MSWCCKGAILFIVLAVFLIVYLILYYLHFLIHGVLLNFMEFILKILQECIKVLQKQFPESKRVGELNNLSPYINECIYQSLWYNSRHDLLLYITIKVMSYAFSWPLCPDVLFIFSLYLWKEGYSNIVCDFALQKSYSKKKCATSFTYYCYGLSPVNCINFRAQFSDS